MFNTSLLFVRTANIYHPTSSDGCCQSCWPQFVHCTAVVLLIHCSVPAVLCVMLYYDPCCSAQAYKHESTLGLHVCFVHQTQLWMVMPYMEVRRTYAVVLSMCTCLLRGSFLPASIRHSLLLGSLQLAHLFRLQA
jgi:hypothetical protein